MGFWKKFGTIVGRVAVQAGVSALEAKASGKPITIGTVGPGVLGDVLRRGEETDAPYSQREMPAPVGLGLYSVFDPTAKAGGRLDDIRFFTNFERADEFAQLVRSTVMMSERVGDRLEWVPVAKGK
ncbi:MAG: hypothetical protein IT554_05835 [Sphingomonadaceae bacterium]|nr:hypothetical protein [Sphingomonadaceae bacterium]